MDRVVPAHRPAAAAAISRPAAAPAASRQVSLADFRDMLKSPSYVCHVTTQRLEGGDCRETGDNWAIKHTIGHLRFDDTGIGASEVVFQRGIAFNDNTLHGIVITVKLFEGKMDEQPNMKALIDKDRGFVTVKLSKHDFSHSSEVTRYLTYVESRQQNTAEAKACLKQLVSDAVASKCRGSREDIRGAHGLDLYMF